MNQYACVVGRGKRQRVHLGPLALRLPPIQLAALVAHEIAHIDLGHRQQRVAWLFTGEWMHPRRWQAKVWQQEFDADKQAAESGHSWGLMAFLMRIKHHPSGFWHPPTRDRIKRISAISQQLAEQALKRN